VAGEILHTRIAITGVRDTIRALNRLNPEAAKALRGELSQAAALVQRAAKSAVPGKVPLSGWNTSQVLKPRVRLNAASGPGWPAWKSLKRDIKVTKAATDRDRRTKTRTTIAVYSQNPAAIIYEFAKQSHTPTHFSGHLPTSRSGRIMWAGYDSVVGEVHRKIGDALVTASRIIQASIDKAKV
jgi:hypothetical protein